MAEPAAHPDDATLLELLEGRLRGEALDAVDAHLDGCASCRDLVATLSSGPRPRSAPGRPAAVGRFTIVGALGEGAMGIVYAAHDPELDRPVALKLLHADGADAKRRARLVREAQSMAKLSHPNVVTVYEVGTEGDEVYVAMEHVEGCSLREWLDEERSTEATMQVLLQAGRGLAAAHAAGLVHRDFKPENVLVAREGHVAKVGDFGLARGEAERIEAPADAALLDATLTRTGALLGTPAYMAPELFDGAVADARSDQFAFAVTAHEALTGARPFADARTVAELRDAARAGLVVAPTVPAPLAPVLRRALAADPANRFDSMDALLAAASPAPRRRAGWAVAMGLVAVGASVALAFSAFEPSSPEPCAAAAEAFGDAWSEAHVVPAGVRPALSAWVARWRAGRVDACEATHVRHEQSEARLDARVRCLDRARATFIAVRDALQDEPVLTALPDPDACARLDGRVAPPPAARTDEVAELENELGPARVAIAAVHPGALAAARVLAERAESIGYPPTLARARLLLAEGLMLASEPDAARIEARAALFTAEAAGADRLAAEAWMVLARVAGAAGRASAADETLEHAAAAIARAGDPADLREALLRVRGVARTELGQLEDAERDLRAALDSMRARLGAEEPSLATVHTSLGNLARLAGDFDTALAEHERALALDRATWGAAHPRVGRGLHNVAGILRRLDRVPEARARYEEALAIKRAALGTDHPEVGLTLNSLGLLAYGDGRDADARARWEEALPLVRGHGDEALVRYNLSLLSLRQERWAEAAAHAEAAIGIDEANLGADAKRVGVAHVALGRARAALGETSQARAAFERARTIGAEVGDPPLVDEATRATEALRPPRRRSSSAPTMRAEPAAMVAEPRAPMGPAMSPEPPEPRRPTGSAVYGAGQAWE